MSENRVPCPYCSEMIMPLAKKCRFCSERLDGKEKPKLPISRLYFLWLSSLIAFFITLFIMRRISGNFSNFAFIALAVIVVFGGISYLGMMIDILKEIRSKPAKKFGLISLITFVSFFWILLNIDSVETQLGFSPISQNQSVQNPTQPTPKPSDKPTPTKAPVKQNTTSTNQTNVSNKVTCTGPDGKQFSTTKKECDDFNTAWGNPPTPDPGEIIRCHIHIDCGGGYKEITRETCDNTTCCILQTGNIFTSKSDCKSKQYNECIDDLIDFGAGLGSAMDICGK